MKKFLISLAILACVTIAVLFGALPYYLGTQAEKTLAEQKAILENSSFLDIESYQYERGWLTSEETYVVRLKLSLLHNIQNYLPENVKTVLQEPLTIHNHVRHGLFADGLTPVKAAVDTEFNFSPEAKKVLARFFGDQAPISMSNTLYLTGGGRINYQIPAFDYEELSGIALNWQGLNGETDYTNSFTEYRNHLTTPGLHIKLADQGDVQLQSLELTLNTQDDNHPVALGSSNLQLGRFEIRWKEGIDYNIKLNELINLVTDLQIGAFINPTGTVAPSHIIVDKLAFSTETTEKDNYIDSSGRFAFDKLMYGDTPYGPLDIHVVAGHLDPNSLAILKTKLAELASKSLSEEAIKAALLQTVKTDAAGLFTHNPKLEVKSFRFTTPEGTVDANGQMGFENLTAEDLESLPAMLEKTHSAFTLNVPQALLEQIAINQASSIFSVNPEDEAAGTASLNDINETLRLMVQSTINTMQNDGYLSVENGIVKTQAALQNGKLLLNGKVFDPAPEAELSEDDFLPETDIASETTPPEDIPNIQ